MSDLINRIRQAQIRAAEDVVIGSLAPELIADPRDAALAAAPDSFVEQGMRLADGYADCAPTGYAAPDRSALFQHLTRQAARCAQLEEDAARYRFLREQPDNTDAPRIDVVHWVKEDESANFGTGLRGDALDTAIDAARSALSAPKEQST